MSEEEEPLPLFTYECEECGDYIPWDWMKDYDGKWYCDDCLMKYMEKLQHGMEFIFGEPYILGYLVRDVKPGDTFGVVRLR